jgi:hypothetical protein
MTELGHNVVHELSFSLFVRDGAEVHPEGHPPPEPSPGEISSVGGIDSWACTLNIKARPPKRRKYLIFFILYFRFGDTQVK